MHVLPNKSSHVNKSDADIKQKRHKLLLLGAIANWQIVYVESAILFG